MKRTSMGFFVLIILCSGLLVPLSAVATTPVISNVAGSINTGQILTITGTNMVNENTANWGSFFQSNPNASGFEGTSPASDGYNHTTGSTIDPLYDTSVKLMGNKSVKYQVHGPGSVLVSYLTVGHGISPWPGDMWLRFYARWNTNYLNTSHLKMIDTFGTTQQYFNPYPKLNGWVLKDNGGVCASVPPPSSGSTVSVDNYTIDINRWYLVELHARSTSPYVYDVYIDGQNIIQSTPCVSEAFMSLGLGIINTRIDSASGWMDHWWDGFAISTTRVYAASTIEISNNSTYGQGTTLYQEPVYLSDGSIQIKANLTGMGSGPFYMWVTNNRRERSASFYIGSGLGMVNPSPPSNLQVQ
jgi:hypothetical protein